VADNSLTSSRTGNPPFRSGVLGFRLPANCARPLLLSALLVVLIGCSREQPEAWSKAEPADAGTTRDRPITDPVEEARQAQEIRRRLVDAGSPVPEWTPQLDLEPDEDVDQLLARAAQALAEGQFLRGENSALALYLSALDREPGNAAAEEGVESVLQGLSARIPDLIERGELDTALLYAQTLLRLRPEEAGFETQVQRLNRLREQSMLVAEADRLAAAGRLIEPPGENAAAIYREVLRESPDHREAQRGLNDIERELIARALAMAEVGDYAESDRLLAEAGRLRPGSQAVQNASTRVVELRQERARQLLDLANAAIEAGELDEAERLERELGQVSAQAQELDELHERIVQARLYGGRRPGSAFSEVLASGGEGPVMVVIPTGSFLMGSPSREPERKPNEGPQRTVRFERGFAIGRFEVSVGEFARFVESSGYVPTSQSERRSTVYDERSGSLAERRGVTWRDDYAGQRANDTLPVVHVSFLDAEAYTNWLSEQTGKRYRLPSEAEFEYVLRAGSQSAYPWGDGSPGRPVGNLTGDGDRSPSRRTWSNAFKGYSDGYWGPAPVGSFEANAFGLHDISGNVSEWTLDCWHDTYARGPVDGSAWVNPGCARRMIRGGSWASAPDQARSAFRLTAQPAATNARVGFRVAREL